MKTTLGLAGLLLTGVVYNQAQAPAGMHDLGDVWGPFEDMVDASGDIGVAAIQKATETVQVTETFLILIAVVLLLRVTWPTVDRGLGHLINRQEAASDEEAKQADHRRRIELMKLEDELRRRE